MMRQYELVERVQKYDPEADEALLNRAYVYAMKAHGHQKRASGDPYFSHPLEVAAILTELRLDDATIATALLHDVIEDTDATKAEIDQLFGAEIGALVEGLTKIKKLDLVSKKAEQAENFRKLLVAISSDIRVLLVKLADRLHNMRTLEHMRSDKRERVSQETLDIYAPLAGRMGMQALREELEDHAFRWLHPDAYAAVGDKLAEIRARNHGLVVEIGRALEAKLGEVGIQAEVRGREKKPYAIWSKMANKQISLEQLSDIYAFRVIVGSIDDCYRVLGVAHTTWRTVPGRFKDYISTPKQNNYQSVHTTVVGPRHQRVELQIRTKSMHRVAEYGVAAHALYKDHVSTPQNGKASPAASNGDDRGPYAWLRHMVEALLDGSNPEEFLEHTKLELFQDQVFCFTPKGRLIALPRNATPLDFAYAVHTDIGNAAVGAFLNGRHVPIDTRLRNGDEVEIQTSKTHAPPAAWEGFAVTGRARSAIRRAARDAVRRQYAELGRRLLTVAFERVGADYSDEKLKRVLSRIGQRTVDDALAAVARDELPINDVVKAVAPEQSLPEPATLNSRPKYRFDHARGQDGWFNLGKGLGLKFRVDGTVDDEGAMPGGVPIRGWRNDVPVSFEEGGAVPGDRIVGVLTPGQGIRIFQIHSPRLKEQEQARWIDVTWDIDPERPERFPAHLRVTALNEPGTLAEIARVIGETDGNIDNLRMVRRAADFTEMYLEVEVWDLEHLNRIIGGLKSKTSVALVERVFG
ncbi:MAG: bifunctional (p)ppGpp synthetase/guanosine-3',5'-bis(diphosphate) 3'-pyrophosphohydrolase [Hyphomicrobium sp.]|mgnify:FL=1|nr:bifunctional (p)ppGpp synthetase/guanosine-3',5'-bis(diphosphate) 3'-pyrophosphohydrolase [Hyphomicrobium sp.]PPC82126.1 MAG: bifunctional (p)ppGpp synthetase/guanosine-3',5'-bis(diphosphate) 3'-pyrophosphohydrolase [Hyphomicrobium sp.]